MVKKTLYCITLLLALYLAPDVAASDAIEVHIFSSPTCPHCVDAKNFFDDLSKEKEGSIVVTDHNISRSVDVVEDYYMQYNVPKNQHGLVPAIFIGDQYFIGFSDHIADDITALLDEKQEKDTREIKIPIFGSLDIFRFSLPALAITLGIVDGFNVCSLGALMMILSLVMIFGSRKKVFVLGGTFLAVTALMYALLIFLWHQLFALIAPHVRSMELVIGILAMSGGVYLFREFYKSYKSGPICSSNDLMSRLAPKIEQIFKNKASLVVLFVVVTLFAIAVTIIEFPCSAFLPVLFTSILVDAGISGYMSVFYIGLYMAFYLLDEVILFLIATFTLRLKIVSPKFIIFFNVVAASIFIMLGTYYLFV